MSDYTIRRHDEVKDWMEEYPDFGEMRSFTEALEAEEVAFTWRRMPPKTGGKGSYGHRHRRQEEIFFVVSGKVQFKIGDEVVDVGERTAVRIATHAWRSVWNDGPDEAVLVITSPRLPPELVEAETEQLEDFWPE